MNGLVITTVIHQEKEGNKLDLSKIYLSLEKQQKMECSLHQDLDQLIM